MSPVTPPRLPRGMRDLLPEQARRRRLVVETLVETFERFGFEPLETPAVELASTLKGKYGPDAERLIYRAGLGAEDDLGLRYDLTVPLARAVAAYDALPRPFRRYQVAPVWRGERPQRGRYREFVQADVDIVGSSSLLADAEIIAVVVRALEALGLPATRTLVNNRKLVDAIGRYAGVAPALRPGLYRSIDKLDRIGLEGVRRELRAVGLPGELTNRMRQAVGRWLRGQADRARLAADLGAALGADDPDGARAGVEAFLDALTGAAPGPADAARDAAVEDAAVTAGTDALRRAFPAGRLIADDQTERLIDLLRIEGESDEVLATIARRLGDAAGPGVDEIRAVLDALDAAGLDAARYAVDFRMVRGLEYYTGTIFETVVPEPPIGSITGGGRYDGLIRLFGPDLPAVGTSLGVDRLVDVLEALDRFPSSLAGATAEVLVARFGEGEARAAIAAAASLRAAGIRTELFLDEAPLGDQIRYALRRGMRAVVIAGPDEVAAGAVAVRNLEAGAQATVPEAELVAAVRAALVS